MPQGYTNIPDWMLELDLDVYETIILAVIFGFSQDGESTFKGSHKYLANKAKCSRRKVVNVLASLMEKNLIKKIDVDIRGIHLCEYKISEYCTRCTGYARGAQGCAQDAQGGCARGAHNNIDIDIIEDNIDNKSSFSLPYDSENFKELWATLIKQPKWKKKSHDALQLSLNKLSKVSESDSCQMMEDTIANGWQGLFPPKPTTTSSGFRKESVYEHNMRVMQNLLGNDA